MNHPLAACHSHFQEVADLANELQRYKNRPTQNENDNQFNNMQLMDLGPDLDVDATFTEHDDEVGESDWSMDDGVFVEEYEGAAKDYGTGTTFMDEFDGDQYSGERIQNLYYPFASRNKWELAAFLLRSDLSMASIDSFLSLNLVRVSFATCTYNYLCSTQVKGLNLSFDILLRGYKDSLKCSQKAQCGNAESGTLYIQRRKNSLYSITIHLNAYNRSYITLS